MALVDRLDHSTDPDVYDHIANHAFSANVFFYLIGEHVKNKIVNDFNLTTAEENQLVEIKNHYDGLSAGNQRWYHSRLEAAGVLLESGLITQNKWKNLMGVA